jgi:hypothetical protein
VAFALAVVLGLGASTSAEAYVQGPMNWPAGFASQRYPRHAGVHRLSMYHCGSQTHRMELRVDVVNRKDIGYGMKSYRCGSTVRSITSNVDSYQGAYRGHFMQVEDAFYGTLRDA